MRHFVAIFLEQNSSEDVFLGFSRRMDPVLQSVLLICVFILGFEKIDVEKCY